MSLARWNPFREFEEFFNQYPRLGKGPGAASQELLTAADWAPAVDISETPQAYLIKAELAGVRREDIQVRVEGGQLRLSGERKFEKEEKDKKQHPCGTLLRQFLAQLQPARRCRRVAD